MNLSRLIVGLILAVAGVGLLIACIFLSEGRFTALFYGVFSLIIGIVILLNKKEDEIEKIKWKKK